MWRTESDCLTSELELDGFRCDCYNNSWDWIIPVLRKIQSIYETDKSFGVLIDISTTHVRISSDDFTCTIGKPDENWIPFDISNVYHVVVEFIKFYNQK
jgi:hypothetical protein